MPLPVGLVYDAAGHVVLDPDTAVQHALRHLFDTFAATGSAVRLRQGVQRRRPTCCSPGATQGPPQGRAGLEAAAASHRAAGAAQSPLRRRVHLRPLPPSQTARRQEWSSTLLPRAEWISFIPDAHPGYITLDQYDANRARLAANAAAHGRDRAAGPPREGTRAAAGHHHLRPLRPADDRPLPPSAAASQVPTYVCQRDGIENAQRICANHPRRRPRPAPSASCCCDTLTPLAAEAALTVSAELEHRAADADAHPRRPRRTRPLPRRPGPPPLPGRRPRQPARRRHPRSRLEHRPARTQRRPRRLRQGPPAAHRAAHRRPEDPHRPAGHRPARHLERPATPIRERKRIARLLLTDVTVTRDSDTITAHVRFSGGADTTLTLPAPKPVGEQRKTPAKVVAAVDELLDDHTSGEIADILNHRGLTSGTGQPFHHTIVDHIIRTYRLRSRRQRLRAAGMLTLTEMANLLGVSRHTLKAWHRAGIVSGQRYNDKGETLYHSPDPDNPPQRPKIGRRPKRADQPEQETPHASTR